MVGSEPVFDVSSAVAVLNQTLEFSYPTITIIGELSEFRVSKDKWLYFDIKDDSSKLKCFGTVFQLRMPLEDGMQIEIVAQPRLHNLYGFSLNIKSIRPVGAGSIKKAADLLFAQLDKEGLFAHERKRAIPYAPERVGLIASGESAAYADFIKVMEARWQGTHVFHYEVHVQGESAPADIVSALHYFNGQASPVDVLVIIRGGGSADDLSAFSTEPVTRAVAASRIPTVVAIGHEVDQSLAELAADLAASTPSNAAELLFPDAGELRKKLQLQQKELKSSYLARIMQETAVVQDYDVRLSQASLLVVQQKATDLQHSLALLKSSHPQTTLQRGFALITRNGKLISTKKSLTKGDSIEATFRDGAITATIKEV